MQLRSKLAVAALAVLAGGGLGTAQSASHREAPLIALDPAADITDTYAFVNWNGNKDKVVFIMNVIPSQEPSAGPNYFFFDDSVKYAINVDLNRNGIAGDLVFEVRFKTELRNALAGFGLKSPVANIGRPELGLQITALDGPGSDGLGIRQSYSVDMIKRDRRGRAQRTRLKALDGKPLFAVPSNQGPLTMPSYEDLAKQGVRDLEHGIRVFAGQRDEIGRAHV